MDCESDGADVLGFLTLPARADVELDALAVLERLVPVALDLRVVDKDVLAFVTRDEPVTLLRVEELHSACSHASFPFVLRVAVIRGCFAKPGRRRPAAHASALRSRRRSGLCAGPRRRGARARNAEETERPLGLGP